MKKNFLKIRNVLIVFFVFFITACAGASDWYYDLPNNYRIVLFNSYDVRFVKTDDNIYDNLETDLKLDDYVKEFCYNKNYVFLKCIKRSIIDSYSAIPMSKILDKITDEQIDYYVINIENNIATYSFSKEEFDDYIKELNLEGMTEWMDTYTTPKDAKY